MYFSRFSEEIEDTIKRFKELQKRSKLQSSRGDPRCHAIFREFQKRSIWGRIWSWENFRPCKTLFLEECSCQIEEGSKDWRGICHVISRREGFRGNVICCRISSLEEFSPHKTRFLKGCDCQIEESSKDWRGICQVISRLDGFRGIVICCRISSLEKFSPHKTRLQKGCDCWIEESSKDRRGFSTLFRVSASHQEKAKKRSTGRKEKTSWLRHYCYLYISFYGVKIIFTKESQNNVRKKMTAAAGHWEKGKKRSTGSREEKENLVTKTLLLLFYKFLRF